MCSESLYCSLSIDGEKFVFAQVPCCLALEEEFSIPKHKMNANETVSARSVLVTAAFTWLRLEDGILRGRWGYIKVGGQGVLKCVFWGPGCNNMLLGKGCQETVLG